MWICIQLAMIACAIFVVLSTWFDSQKNPTVTSLHTQYYPVWGIPFPAVAVCNVNSISRRAAEKYADFLSNKSSIDSAEILPLLRYLGRLYDFEADDEEEMVKLQNILEKYDANETTGFFDVRKRMEYLSPKCDTFITKCSWKGELFDCGTGLRTRKTSNGFCCTFNYVYPIDNEKFSIRLPQKPDSVGSDQGLILVLNASTEDYFYPLRNSMGLMVHIFNPLDFPDIPTGSFYEQMVGNATEMFMRLNFESVIADESVKAYSTSQRGCLFETELYTEYGGNYTHSQCLLKCRIRSVIALCNCIPFQYPANFVDGLGYGVAKCTLSDIACLSRYKVKWQIYRPIEGVDLTGMEGVMEDSLSCPSCWPSCTTVTYIPHSISSDMVDLKTPLDRTDILCDIDNITDLSVVRIFFPTFDSYMYKKSPVSTWYEMFSSVGGMLGLCMGFSIISILEIIYYMTVRLYQNRQNADITYIRHEVQKRNMFRQKKVSNFRRMQVDSGHAENKSQKLFYLE